MKTRNDRILFIATSISVRSVIGPLAPSSDHQQHHRGRRRDPDGCREGGMDRRQAQPCENGVDGDEGESRLEQRGLEQRTLLPRQIHVEQTPQLKEDQAKRDVHENLGAGKHFVAEESGHAGAKEKPMTMKPVMRGSTPVLGEPTSQQTGKNQQAESDKPLISKRPCGKKGGLHAVSLLIWLDRTRGAVMRGSPPPAARRTCFGA